MSNTIRFLLGLCLTSAAHCYAADPQPSCPPVAFPVTEIKVIKASGWQMADAERRQLFALGLQACLSDPDPELRDGVAFEGLSAMMREKLLSTDTLTRIYQDQLMQLGSTTDDPTGFAKPFAALVLAEIARVDRLQPFLSARQRNTLLEAATGYLRGVGDYRGFTPGEGWRHGVAHAADLLLQLTLNPAVDAKQLESIVQSIGIQVVPTGAHFYIYGESDRLARPVLFAARRGLLVAQDWNNFLGALASPLPMTSWGEAFKTQEGLARLHNTRAFFRTLALALQGANDASKESVLIKPVAAALAQLP
jgi:hypothetical protein